MLKNVRRFRSSIHHRIRRNPLNTYPAYKVHCSISTNSAIHRGIRKAKQGRSNLDPPTHYGGTTLRHRVGRESNVPQLPAQSSRLLPRSFLGECTPRAVRRRSPTLRQHRSLDAGFGDHAADQHHPSPNRPDWRRRGETSLSSSSGPQSRSTTKGAVLNRAERRAAVFGHKKNPPEGYKALPVTFGQQQHSAEKRQEGARRLSLSPATSHERTHIFDNSATGNQKDGRHWTSKRGGELGLNDSKEHSNKLSEERPQRISHAPIAIPYTTPASEFLYGHSVVTSALKSSRRKFYKLYLYTGDSVESRGQDKQVRKLALAANVEVTRVGNDWLKLMDKMSGGRPHNGYILEASPLAKPPITGLRRMPNPKQSFEVILDHQSREEEAVNGTKTAVSYGTGYLRYPFLMLLDGIRDPGNMGAILRSAHFLGADGIVLCTRNTATLSPIALKAAVGAAETLPLFSVGQPGNFVDVCQQNGWKFYAAVSPSSSDSGKNTGRPYYSTTTLGSPAEKHPCVLILGSEGEGIQRSIQNKADYLVGIDSARPGYGDLDSLNVSVAAALLCDAFLRKPAMTGKSKSMRQTAVIDATDTGVRREISGGEFDSQESGSSSATPDDQRLF
ncbi:MAG: hypothetical protein Q9179_002002 [Wetmoreana sp. 5 TL-2023]